MIKPVRTRIAPSPTGEDLHIGNAYTALINYVFAQKNHGQFIIRIEDTDRTRYVEGSEDRILQSLKWLGLEYAEGPDIDGPYKPYRQSQRLEIYKKCIQQLIDNRNAYYCFCSAKRLEEVRVKQTALKLPTLYDGLCKKIPSEVAKKRTKSEPHVIRLNVPEEGTTSFRDLIRGDILFENRLIDDQVLIKSDGFPTYHFGVVVDDHEMEISHVIRGEEWISSTPKHILLYKAFGWDLPIFAHTPLLRNPDKSKLSKRKNPVWVSWYKKEGILPEALINYLALMGWSMPASPAGGPDGRDKFTLDEMIKEFKLEDIKTSAPIFDIEKLKWLNKKYLQEFSTDKFVKLVSTVSTYRDNPDFKEITIKSEELIKPRISTAKEYDKFAAPFYNPPKHYEMDLANFSKVIEGTVSAFDNVNNENWNASTIGDVMKKTAQNMGVPTSEYFMKTRIALTGSKVSAPLNETMEILGKEKTIEYLEKARKS